METEIKNGAFQPVYYQNGTMISEQEKDSYFDDAEYIQFTPIVGEQSQAEESPEIITDNTEPALYLNTIQSAINEQTSSGMGGWGMLYDLDGNGVEELVIINDIDIEDRPCRTCSVYTIRGGSVVSLLDNKIMITLAGGSGTSCAGLVERDGVSYFAIHTNKPDGQDYPIEWMHEEWYLYTISDDELSLAFTNISDSTWNYGNGQNPLVLEESTGNINGQNVPYMDYEVWHSKIGSIALVYAMDVYDGYDPKSKGVRLEYLMEQLQS